jgi:NAD(P)H-hydrate repair Nnr-like enzyme with NAD(P)H-hydrate epimerase domain
MPLEAEATMAAILTAAEMRALEQEAIASGEVTGLELMERAGRGVVEAILAEWPDIEQGSRAPWSSAAPATTAATGSWSRGC